MLNSSTKETFSEGQPEGVEALQQRIKDLEAQLRREKAVTEVLADRDHLTQVQAFHHQFNLDVNTKPGYLSSVELAEFRANFLQEELNEYCQAHGLVLHSSEEQGEAVGNKWVIRQVPEGEVIPQLDLEKCLDALIDLEYVLLGTVHLHGFSGIYHQAFARVQAANMSKVRVERPEDSKRGSGFDVVKPEGWEAPVFADLLDHAEA